jgi:TolB-like protein/Tfp pilus assembly protein PilF
MGSSGQAAADAEAVREELDRVLGSRVFRTSQRSQTFLRYLVDKSLAGAVPKEFEIAMDVLGRGQDYDPAVDATVRVEAGRLRSRLRDYYSTEGRRDLVVIEIPKGGYAAAFRAREVGMESSGAHLARIVSGSSRVTEPPEGLQPSFAQQKDKESRATSSADVRVSTEKDAGAKRPVWRWRVWVVAAAGLATIAGLAWWAEGHRVRASGPIRSLAVLPLENLSGSADQEYFADGMTDELITELARIPNLEVVSRTSVMQDKGSKKPLAQIARELGVDAIVEGSVVRSGDRIRITAQLIDARNDRHLWAQSFEERVDDPLTLQDRIAGEIAAQTKAAILPARASGGGTHVSPAAYDAYLRGLYFFNLREAHKSSAYFEQAIALDPQYAAAYAGLASALDTERVLGEPRTPDGQAKAHAAAARAIQLDPQSGEAYTALGFIEMGERNWAAGGADLEKAIALSPSYSLAEMGYSVYLDAQGRPEEAVTHMRRALKLDPLSFFMNRHLGSTLLMARHYDESLIYLNRAAEMEPSRLFLVLSWEIRDYEGSGRIAEAEKTDLQNLAFTYHDDQLAPLRSAYARSGWKGYQAAKIDLLSKNTHNGCESFEVGESYLKLGDRDHAISWIDRSIDQGCFWTDWLRAEPWLDDLRDDPRFPGLLRRMHL